MIKINYSTWQHSLLAMLKVPRIPQTPQAD